MATTRHQNGYEETFEMTIATLQRKALAWSGSLAQGSLIQSSVTQNPLAQGRPTPIIANHNFAYKPWEFTNGLISNGFSS